MNLTVKKTYLKKLSNEYKFAAPKEFIHRTDMESPMEREYRNNFMRDRVLYSSAFQRLTGKTQIYLAGTDKHCHNRLTHTLEVSQIARTISCTLGLDENLTEALALTHNLGSLPSDMLESNTFIKL